jgi:superfamily II RNA helicase
LKAAILFLASRLDRYSTEVNVMLKDAKINKSEFTPSYQLENLETLLNIQCVYPTLDSLRIAREKYLSMKDKEDVFDLGFVPDKWQWDMIQHVRKQDSVLVCAPTSSGKTFISLYL